MFLEDPSEIITPVESRWIELTKTKKDIRAVAEKDVFEWRFAADDVFLPNHPFWRTIDARDSDLWRVRPIHWVDEGPEDAIRFRHGLDAEQRVVIGGRFIVQYGDGFHDIIAASRDTEKDCWRAFSPQHRTGFPTGTLTRYLTDDTGRIFARVTVNNAYEEPEHHNRGIVQYEWLEDRLVAAYHQGFDYGSEIPAWASDLSPEHQADMYRQANDKLREFTASRHKWLYSYDKSGRLVKVVEADETGRDVRETRYTWNPKDTIEKVSKKLVSTLVKAITKAGSSVKDGKPIHRIALIYSAEHAHCGLPTQVLLASENDTLDNQLDWEGYPHEAPWPPAARTGKTINDLTRRLLVLVEGDPKFADDFQPRPYREVLWLVCREIYNAMASKRITTDDFAIFPIDDHSDVDAAEDVRESLPKELADQILQK